MQPYNFSIVLPMCKPHFGWEADLIKNIKLLEKNFDTKVSFEVIVVNDGYENEHLLSLFDVIEDANANIRFISYKHNRGKGYALRTGVKAALAHYIITTDLDFPYEFKHIAEVYDLLKSGKEIVVGRRCENYYAKTPLKRRLISKACIAMNKHLLNLPMGDAQSGLKGFNKNGRNIFLETSIDRFLVDTEFLVLATKRNCNLSVVHLNLKPGVSFSNMGWQVLLTEGRNFYKIFKMTNRRSIKKKVVAYEASVANV
jgi:dolichyl-phosphate beta-glucosyltransferase